ncbi:MAG: alpha-hydroxy-acid oxidizing protein [Acidimicrobiales bacterium]|nr:alpha-hydroxy-acid oxidizing protein [Acidimicrobiales bacterium]
MNQSLKQFMEASDFSSVYEAREMARKILPRVVFDYVDGGAEDEVTMRANVEAFDKICFNPRMAQGPVTPNLKTSILGHEIDLPVILAPCGLVRAMHPDAGGGVAQAARNMNTISILSTVAGSDVKDVAPRAPGLLWFQLYSTRGKEDSLPLMERAKDAGVTHLVVTVDTPALGNRERDRRNGVQTPLRIDARSALRLGPQVLARPRWTYQMARDGLQTYKSKKSSPKDSGSEMLSMGVSPFSWSDITWIKEQWGGPLIVKGILSGRDAQLAIDSGAEAVVVSNHGGRQLEGSPATISVLSEVVSSVEGRCEVFVDGGIRRGSHVVKALSLGAKAVLIGRPYLYGLAVSGQVGVERVLKCFRSEVIRTMTLLGCPDVNMLDSTWLQG